MRPLETKVFGGVESGGEVRFALQPPVGGQGAVGGVQEVLQPHGKVPGNQD